MLECLIKVRRGFGDNLINYGRVEKMRKLRLEILTDTSTLAKRFGHGQPESRVPESSTTLSHQTLILKSFLPLNYNNLSHQLCKAKVIVSSDLLLMYKELFIFPCHQVTPLLPDKTKPEFIPIHITRYFLIN